MLLAASKPAVASCRNRVQEKEASAPLGDETADGGLKPPRLEARSRGIIEGKEGIESCGDERFPVCLSCMRIKIHSHL